MPAEFEEIAELTFKTKTLNLIRSFFQGPWPESILLRLVEGKEPSHFLSKFVPNHYQYPRGSIRSSVRNGINYELDISDLIQWFIYFRMQDRARNNLYSLISPQDVIFDVGTNIGDVLLNCARIVESKGMVYGFEPALSNYQSCLKNIALNRFRNISVTQKGLGDVAGKFQLIVASPRNHGMNRISNDLSKESSTVEVCTLDEFVATNSIERLDLIKVDVEGFEKNVLVGGTLTIQRLRPKLFLELDDQLLIRQGSSAKDLFSYVKSIGYSMINAETNIPLKSADHLQNCHFDIICLPESSVTSSLAASKHSRIPA